MNWIARGMDERDELRRQQAEADAQWLRETAGIDPAARLLAWDAWLRAELARSLSWPKDEAKKARLIGQCAAEITNLSRQLRGRGWLLDGKALAVHVRELLGPIAAAQKAGKVREFWLYFKKAVGVYVGGHAEEISAHARRTGAHEGALSMGEALAGVSLTELFPGGPAKWRKRVRNRSGRPRNAGGGRTPARWRRIPGKMSCFKWLQMPSKCSLRPSLMPSKPRFEIGHACPIQFPNLPANAASEPARGFTSENQGFSARISLFQGSHT